MFLTAEYLRKMHAERNETFKKMRAITLDVPFVTGGDLAWAIMVCHRRAKRMADAA